MLSEQSDVDNFRHAVVLFKEHGTSIPANEYLIILQLLRRVNLHLTASDAGAPNLSLDDAFALKSGGADGVHLFRAILPKPLQTALLIKGNENVELDELKQMTCVMAMRARDAAIFG